MTGIELRAARLEIGLRESELADAVGVPQHQVFEWERADAPVPKSVASLVRSQLYAKRASGLLAGSGLAECSEAATLQERVLKGGFRAADVEADLQHHATCPRCLERRAYVQARLGAPPADTGLWLFDWFRPVWGLTGWKQSAVGGIAFIFAWVALGILISLGVAVVEGDARYLLWTLALLGVAIVGGGAGGLVHHWTGGLRGERLGGYLLSGVLAVAGYVAGTGAFLWVLLAAAGDSLPDAEQVRELFDEPASPVILPVLCLLFGSVLGWQMWKGAGQGREPIVTREQPAPVSWWRRWLWAPVLAGSIALGIWRFTSDAPYRSPASRRASEEAAVELAMGDKALRERGPAEALPHFEAAVAKGPRWWRTHNGLGWALVLLRRYEDAVPHFETAIDVAPEERVPRHNLGWALANLGRFDEAAAQYREVLRLDPLHQGAVREYAWVLVELGRGDDAVSLARAAAQRRPAEAARLADLAAVLMQLGRHGEALVAGEGMVRKDSFNADAWGLVARLAYNAADIVRARHAMRRALELDSTYLDRHPEQRLLGRELTPGSASRAAP